MSEAIADFDLEEYIEYQMKIAELHVVPTLRALDLVREGPFLDIGCGPGGFSISLSELTGLAGQGCDISRKAIETARRMASRLDADVEFTVQDILAKRDADTRFPLLLLRDVIEHVSDPAEALRHARGLVTDDGALYVTFPPWYGPFAGHQHNAESVLKFMPYLHAVSPRTFLALAHRLESRRTEWLKDERQIVSNRISIGRFERMVSEARWTVDLRRSYVIRPALIRMGFPPVRNRLHGKLPFLSELLTTGCEYVLRPTRD